MQMSQIGQNLKALQLNQYYLSEAIAKAMGLYLHQNYKKAGYQGVEVLILNENGLTDQGLNHILLGIHEARSLESLNISKN